MRVAGGTATVESCRICRTIETCLLDCIRSLEYWTCTC